MLWLDTIPITSWALALVFAFKYRNFRIMKRLLILALFLPSCASPKAAGVVPYTSDMCMVTDNKLGSMGDPITKVYDGREVKFCCRPCIREFEDDPEQFWNKSKAKGTK
jgi:YHS domain-containing protein